MNLENLTHNELLKLKEQIRMTFGMQFQILKNWIKKEMKLT